MTELANYLGITDEQIEELGICLQQDTGSSGDMVYSYWFTVPHDISEEIRKITCWKGGELVSGIPVNVVEAEEWSQEHALDDLLREIFLPGQSPYKDLKRKITEYRELVLEHKDKATGASLQAVLFAATIGALEAYLWEIVNWKIDNDARASVKILQNCQGYGQISFKLSDIVSEGFSPKTHLKQALNNLVWHRVEQVAPLLSKGLGVNLPSLKFFVDAAVLRHHIVHRSGKDLNGEVVLTSFVQVTELFDDVLIFAENIDRQLYTYNVSHVSANQWI